MPELFCGFTRRQGEAPTQYPVACSPQAWAAAAPLLLLRTMLRFEPDIRNGEIRLAPALPDRLSADLASLIGEVVTTERVAIEVEHVESALHIVARGAGDTIVSRAVARSRADWGVEEASGGCDARRKSVRKRSVHGST